MLNQNVVVASDASPSLIAKLASKGVNVISAGLSLAAASLGQAPKVKQQNKCNQRKPDPVQDAAIAQHNYPIELKRQAKKAASKNIGKHSVSARQAKKVRKLLKLHNVQA